MGPHAEVPERSAVRAHPKARQALPAVLFWAGFVLLVYGFVSNTLWCDVATGPTLVLSELAAASVVAAYVLGRLLRCRLATAMLAVWLVALACFAGFAASVAVLFIAVVAMAMGSCLVPASWRGNAALSALAGLALMVGAVGWSLPFHMEHIRVVYIIVMLIIVAWRWKALGAMLQPLPQCWSEAVAAAPAAAAFAMIALGVASTAAWLPTMLYDDLAYHIGLPAQLATLSYYQMNAGSNVWALAGWSADILHGVAWVIAGEESRGAVNTLWFALSAALMWRLSEELELNHGLRWLAIALFASTPELAYTLASMQTEGPTIAVMLGLALLIQRNWLPERGALTVIAVLFGLLVGLKISNLWFVLPLALWLLWRWHFRLPWRSIPGALLLAIAVGGSSYVYAWMLTGNPVLPVFNGIFHSPFYPSSNYYDSRWYSGFGWNIIWRVVFHSSEFIEGGSAAAPFFLIGFAGSLLVALARPRSRPLSLVAAACFLLPLSIIQYLRYATPALALLAPAMLCGMPQQGIERVSLRRARATAAWLLVLGALVFVSNVAWQFKDGVLQTLLTSGDEGVFAKFAPTRQIAQVIRDRYGDTARTLMLLPSQPYAAELAGKGFAVVWYDPTLYALAQGRGSTGDDSKWNKAIGLTGANLLVTNRNAMYRGVEAVILHNHGTLVYSAGSLDLWQLHSGRAGAGKTTSNHGIAVTFPVAGAPKRRTLVHGQLDLACNPQLARQGHIVVGWQVVEVTGDESSHYAWVPCEPDGSAHATFDRAVRHEVRSFSASVQPDPIMNMGLELIDSRVSFRVDRTAEDDLSRRLRRELAFWSKFTHSEPAVHP